MATEDRSQIKREKDSLAQIDVFMIFQFAGCRVPQAYIKILGSKAATIRAHQSGELVEPT